MSDKFSQHELMENIMEHSQQLLDSLIDIKINGPMIKTWGICDNLKDNDYLYRNWDEWSTYLEQLIAKWPKFSGNKHFPVPSTNLLLTPKQIYILTYNEWAGEYGALRIELLDFLIEQLTLEVGEHNEQ